MDYKKNHGILREKSHNLGKKKQLLTNCKISLLGEEYSFYCHPCRHCSRWLFPKINLQPNIYHHTSLERRPFLERFPLKLCDQSQALSSRSKSCFARKIIRNGYLTAFVFRSPFTRYCFHDHRLHSIQ